MASSSFKGAKECTRLARDNFSRAMWYRRCGKGGKDDKGGKEDKKGKEDKGCDDAGGKVVTLKNMNPHMIKLEYAVRGPLVKRAGAIEKELTKGTKKPFTKVIRANLGDAHAMGQKPITFLRQVISCVTFPELIENYQCFPEDVKERALAILDACAGKSVGSYSVSYGIEMIRKDVAQFIERRDGHPCDYNNVVLTTGASTGIKNILQLFSGDSLGDTPSGVMVPIPQYPLYSASIAEYALVKVDYFLDEEKNWGLDVEELERALAAASCTCKVRAIVVINPGNPTGQVLTRQNIEDVIKFAHKHRLLIFADEVYQDNVYADGSEFFSFKKVMTELGPPYSEMELTSFMSVSKGYSGECGLRGGWMEVLNFDPPVQEHLYKCMSAMLCPTTIGQTAVDCVARPPKSGEPSFELWNEERCGVLSSLAERAATIVAAFNEMEGFKCNTVQGAMYAFPRFELPAKAIEAAKQKKQAPDVFYAFQLLEETGICIVAGSGFGQKPGTYHFRTTILPQPAVLEEMLSIFKDFHSKFQKQWN